MEKERHDLYLRMLAEADAVNRSYGPIYDITADVRELGNGDGAPRWLLTVTCGALTCLAREVSSYGEFSEALTRGVGIGLGVDEE